MANPKIDIKKFPKTWNDVHELVDIIENIPSEDLKCDWNSVYDEHGTYEFKLDDRANVYFQYHNFGVYIEVKNIYHKNHIYKRFEIYPKKDEFPTRLQQAIGVILLFISWYNDLHEEDNEKDNA